MLVLLAAPKAVDYYPKIGITQHGSAWTLHASNRFPTPLKGADFIKVLSVTDDFR